jgi:ribulose-phosphate 3-epimerase
MSVKIAPSILSADFAHLADEVKAVEDAGADWLHVDVMDGHFVPNLTVGPVVVHWLKKYTKLPQDVHLMIDDPEKYIPAFAKAGAWLLTVHQEACADPEKTVRLIHDNNCLAGMSVRPKTPIESLEKVLPLLDLILVMTVEPGFGGQSFMPDMMPKVAWLKKRLAELKKTAWIEVDGGINAQTAAVTVQAGANALVAGNAIFGETNRRQALDAIRRGAAAN